VGAAELQQGVLLTAGTLTFGFLCFCVISVLPVLFRRLYVSMRLLGLDLRQRFDFPILLRSTAFSVLLAIWIGLGLDLDWLWSLGSHLFGGQRRAFVRG
jgi:hypothetical protein